MLFRQGDVLIAAIPSIPEQARRLPHSTLAEGEATGHTHRIDEAGGAELFDSAGTLYLRVFADSATVVHQEHGPIALPRGNYRVWQQREYSPTAIRRVVD
jgi:hypothetical protein